VRVPLNSVADFARCPHFYHLSKSESDTLQTEIIKKVIAKCYVKRIGYSKKVEWRVLTNWVDKLVFRDVDIFLENSFQAARKISEDILRFMHRWYHTYYIGDDREGFSNIPLECELGYHSICATAPVFLLDNIPELYIIDTRDIPVLFEDFKLRLYAWLIIRLMEVKKVRIKFFQITERYGMEVRQETFSAKNVSGMDKYVFHIMDSISRNVDYQSITGLCYHCKCKKKCMTGR